MKRIDKIKISQLNRPVRRVKKITGPFKSDQPGRKEKWSQFRRSFNRNLENRLSKNRDGEKAKSYRKLVNIATLTGLILILLAAIYGFRAGYFSDRDKMQALLEGAGVWGPLIFILIQIIQCVIPIIPGGIALLIGVYVFGPWMGFVYNYLGIILGSSLAFYLARLYGKPFVKAMVSEKNYEKYIGRLENNQKKFNVFFMVAMALPGMPDDLICMIAGLSGMKSRWFFFTLLWTKVPTIIAYTLFLDTALDGIKSLFF